MGISKEEREAYKAGRQERKDQENPLTYLFKPSRRPSDQDSSIQNAFDKGLNDDQLDGDK